MTLLRRNEERMGHRQGLETVRGISRQGIGGDRRPAGAHVGESHRQVRRRAAPELDGQLCQSAGGRRHTLPGVHDPRGGRVE